MMIKVFPVLALCLFSSTLGMGIVSPLLPLYAKEMGASGIWLGIIVAAYSISYSLLTLFTGRLSDRKGRKIFLAIGLLAYSITSLGYIWAGNVSQLALVRLAQGVAAAMSLPIAMAYVGDLSPPAEEGKWMGYAQAAFFSGFGFGPLIGGTMTEHFGIAATFLTMSGLNLFAFLVTIFFLPEVMRREKIERSAHLSFKEISGSSVVKGLFSLRLTDAMGRGGITTFLPIFAAMIGMSLSLIGMLLTVNSLSVTLLAPLGGMLADRFNRRALAIIGTVIFIIPMAIIPLTNSFGQLLGVVLFQAIGSAASQTAASAWIVEEGRKYGMGSTMSVFFLAMGIGMATGPILSGVVANLANISSVFYTAAGLGVMGICLLIWFTRAG